MKPLTVAGKYSRMTQSGSFENRIGEQAESCHSASMLMMW